jgi:hypothetical protein
MTPKRLKILQLIRSYWYHHKMGPTLNELAYHMGVKSRSNMHLAVQALIKEGFVSKEGGMHRSTALTSKGLNLCRGGLYIREVPPAPGTVGVVLPVVSAPSEKELTDESIPPNVL